MKLLLLFQTCALPILVHKIISPKVRGDSFASRVYTLLKNAAVVTEFVEKYTALVVVIRAIAPPISFNAIHSPIETISLSSIRANSQVAETKRVNLSMF